MTRSRSGLVLLMVLIGVAATMESSCAEDGRLKRGDAVGAFYVTKVAGAEDDGVSPGENLCYRCRYGSRPLVMVFARRSGGRLTELVRRLDGAVARNRDARLKGMVTFVGRDLDALRQQATEIAQLAEVKQVPVAVAAEATTGPIHERLDADAAVTIVVAKESQVVTALAYQVDDIDVTKVMTEVEQILR